MVITIKLFGPQATLAGEPTVTVEAAGGSGTAAEVLKLVGEAVPELADSLATSRLAVNHEFAKDDDPVTAGDEVALIGMVSGG